MKIKHRGKIIEVYQWFRNGDHPEDNCILYVSPDTGLEFWGEGHVIRYFRHPGVGGKTRCKDCGHQMHIHGWIDKWLRPDRDKIDYVCPGDWIVKVGNDYESYQEGFFSEPDDLNKRRKKK